MSYAVFDIETRIDKGLVKSIYASREAISEDDAYERARAELLERHGSDFFPPPFHVPIAILVGNVTSDWELTGVEEVGGKDASEEAIVRGFWERVEQFRGTLVSFNGRGFDLPVLELQALRYGCQAPRYFNERYGHRHRYSEQGHYDLYDFLSNFGITRLRGGFDLLARLIGLPGKGDIAGADVQGLWEAGRRQEIADYCRRDVIQTYFLFLRVELMRGRLDAERYAQVVAKADAYRRELSGG
jgi:predicted PolB exonuclease-like 3'-5' exonuclease